VHGASWLSMGLRSGRKAYLAVWRLDGSEDEARLPIRFMQGEEITVSCGYPARGHCSWRWDVLEGALTVSLPSAYSARIFELELADKCN